MYWGRPVKIDTALYPISTQRNLAVAPDDISMPLNPILIKRVANMCRMPRAANALVAHGTRHT